MLRKLPAGFDEFVNEKIQDQIAAIFAEWSAQLLHSPRQTSALAKTMALDFLGSSLRSGHAVTVNNSGPWQSVASAIPGRAKARERDLSRRITVFVVRFLEADDRGISGDWYPLSILADPPDRGSMAYVTVVRFELVGTGAGLSS